MVNRIANHIGKAKLSVSRKTMNGFSANGVKQLNHNQNSTAKAANFRRVGVPKIVIEDSANSVSSNYELFPNISDRRKSEPVMTKEQEPRGKGAGGFGGSWLNLHWPERFRRGSRKKLEIEYEGHTLIFCTFKKPTFCDHCSKILTDYFEIEEIMKGNADLQRQGYRCKKCRKTYHEECSKQIDECQGSPIGSFGFNPQNSSNDDFSILQTGSQVDNVYQVIKEGMNLRARKDTDSEKPCSSSSNSSSKRSLHHQYSEPLPDPASLLPEDAKKTANSLESLKVADSSTSLPRSSSSSKTGRKYSQTPLLKQTDDSTNFEVGYDVSSSPEKQLGKMKQKSLDIDNLYVALYKYEAQQKDDLSVKAGGILKILNSKDETWWTGEYENKTGFIPASFVMKLRSKEEVYMCGRSTLLKSLNDTEHQLKRNQVVVVKLDWPVEECDYVYVRCPASEGYVRKEDLNPL